MALGRIRSLARTEIVPGDVGADEDLDQPCVLDADWWLVPLTTRGADVDQPLDRSLGQPPERGVRCQPVRRAAEPREPPRRRLALPLCRNALDRTC